MRKPPPAIPTSGPAAEAAAAVHARASQLLAYLACQGCGNTLRDPHRTASCPHTVCGTCAHVIRTRTSECPINGCALPAHPGDLARDTDTAAYVAAVQKLYDLVMSSEGLLKAVKCVTAEGFARDTKAEADAEAAADAEAVPATCDVGDHDWDDDLPLNTRSVLQRAHVVAVGRVLSPPPSDPESVHHRHEGGSVDGDQTTQPPPSRPLSEVPAPQNPVSQIRQEITSAAGAGAGACPVSAAAVDVRDTVDDDDEDGIHIGDGHDAIDDYHDDDGGCGDHHQTARIGAEATYLPSPCHSAAPAVHAVPRLSCVPAASVVDAGDNNSVLPPPVSIVVSQEDRFMNEAAANRKIALAVVLSKLPAAQRAECEHICRSFSLTLVVDTAGTLKPTVVVTSLNEPQYGADGTSGGIKDFSFAVLRQMVCRRAVVGPNWLLQSRARRQLLPYRDFHALSNHRVSGPPLFADVVALLEAGHQDKVKADISVLIADGGGVVVANDTEFDAIKLARDGGDCRLRIRLIPDSTPAFTMPETPMSNVDGCQRDDTLRRVDFSWLSDCIKTGVCPPANDHIFESCGARTLPSQS
jgi:hypothetical protein